MSKLEITKDLAISITESLPVGVLLIANSNGKITFANPKAENIFGYTPGDILGHSVEALIPEEYHRSHKILMDNYLISPKTIAMKNGRVLTGLKKNGEKVFLQLGITPLNDDYVLLSCVESTNEVIKPSTSYDPLTGLPNRKMFNDYSEKLRQLAARNNKCVAIAFLDLDNFKTINDQFGHKIGDMVLCEVANQLMKHVRASDLIARYGGDEFIICLYDIGNPEHLQTHLDKLINNIFTIKHIEGHSITFGASIGATITDSPKTVDIADMITVADKLMYQAKASGKGVVKINEFNIST